jgi:hypothetical protein
MTRKQNAILALTFIGTLICGVFAAFAFAVFAFVAHASNAAMGWAFAAGFFGGTFKVCARDFGVWN